MDRQVSTSEYQGRNIKNILCGFCHFLNNFFSKTELIDAFQIFDL